MPTESHRNHRPAAFTIPEMLAVVALITIIIALLLPALGKAKESTRVMICQSNMRQFSLANHVYASQNLSWLLPIRAENGAFWMSNVEYRSLLGLEKGADFPPDIRCPSLHPQAVGSGGLKHNFFGWNRTPIGWNDLPIAFRRTQVNAPSSKVQLIEGTDWHIWREYANYGPNWDSFHHTRLWSVAYRHTEGANVTHFDGHTQYYKKEAAYPFNVEDRYRLWDIFY